MSIIETEMAINLGLSIKEEKLSINREELSINQRKLSITCNDIKNGKQKSGISAAFSTSMYYMEHTGFEPVTPSLPAKYSPTELMPRVRQINCSISKYF